MNLRVLPPIISFSVATLFASCESKPDVKSPSAIAANVTTLTNSTILSVIYGKSAGDSAVYDRGKLVESSSSDRDIVAKLLQKQVFQRHDIADSQTVKPLPVSSRIQVYESLFA